jgi:hypothetical protein
MPVSLNRQVHMVAGVPHIVLQDGLDGSLEKA